MKAIRRQSGVPVIMLTALDEEADQLKGFELGVDDYITKPFSFHILIKRVEAVLRRTYQTAESTRKLKSRKSHWIWTDITFMSEASKTLDHQGI